MHELDGGMLMCYCHIGVEREKNKNAICLFLFFQLHVDPVKSIHRLCIEETSKCSVYYLALIKLTRQPISILPKTKTISMHELDKRMLMSGHCYICSSVLNVNFILFLGCYAHPGPLRSVDFFTYTSQ